MKIINLALVLFYLFLNTASAKQIETEFIKVQPGDTLQKISQKYYGTTKKWYKIFLANSNVIENPDSLVQGMQLRLVLIEGSKLTTQASNSQYQVPAEPLVLAKFSKLKKTQKKIRREIASLDSDQTFPNSLIESEPPLVSETHSIAQSFPAIEHEDLVNTEYEQLTTDAIPVQNAFEPITDLTSASPTLERFSFQL